MLKTIRSIVQKVNAASGFGEALQTMVRSICDVMATQACTVFLVDRINQEYVLVATEGLNADAVGKVRLKLDQGIVGLAGQREEPINLEDAQSHPSYTYHSQAGEERFRAFLAVPIIHQRILLGVLIVQQEERRYFDEAEEAFLVTMSAQLAGVIAHAEAIGSIDKLLHPVKGVRSFSLEGPSGAPGIGIGTAVVIYPFADLDAVPQRPAINFDEEVELFNEALKAARDDIKALSGKLSEELSTQERALFDAYLQILDDDSLGVEVIEEIHAGNWAQGALRNVIQRHVRQFESLQDDYLRERSTDIKDLGCRVLMHLQRQYPVTIDYPAATVLVAEEVTAAALAEVPEGVLVGIVSARGSANSHVAILARALGIPAILGVDGMVVADLDSQEVIVDGYNGQVHVAPSVQIKQECLALLEQQRELDADLECLRGLPAITTDGYCLPLYVNVGLAADAGIALRAGAEGVGLYRTEVPFMTRDCFPTEEEQRVVYRQLLQVFAPRPVVMRTLDVGGDKALPYFPVQEDNPFLGWRGLRISLDHPELFLAQLRAMLRASEGFNNLSIMLPMVSSVAEVEEAVRLIKKAYQEVVDEGAVIKMPPIGAMIEVPSAVYQADALAKRVDFLSIGSNDLAQYLLAVDRNNARVANLYDALHPAVLHALLLVVTSAHAMGKTVSICGEMTSDPASVILLLAMGFDVLSLSAANLSRVKWVIRNFSLQEARQILDEVIMFEDPKKIRHHLEQALEKAGLAKLVR